MKVLWAAGKATVHEIRAGLLPDRPLAYTTVMTVMGRLARKGIVERDKRGHAHLYRPAVSEKTIREQALKQFTEDFFQGSQEELRRHLVNGATAVRKQAPAEYPAVVRGKDVVDTSGEEAKTDSGLDASLL